MDEMLARLLAVGDDVDPGRFLELQRDQRGVALGLDQRLAVLPPGRPKYARLGSHEGFGRLPAIVVSSTGVPPGPFAFCHCAEPKATKQSRWTEHLRNEIAPLRSQ
jgi:hypothetical protein